MYSVQTHHLAPAEIQPSHARIMITRLPIKVLPSIQMQMLNLGTLTQPLADVHVIQGLGVLVKQVRVALDFRQTSYLVDIDQARL